MSGRCNMETEFGWKQHYQNNMLLTLEVLVACGVSPEFGKGTIRLTTGRFSTAAEMICSAQAIAASVGRLYGWISDASPEPPSFKKQHENQS